MLTIYERTRELGMLRAVGMTRWQVRWMVTLESVITALIGARDRDRSRGSSSSVLLIVRVDFLVLAWPIVVADHLRARRDRRGHGRRDLPGAARGRLNVLEALQYE